MEGKLDLLRPEVPKNGRPTTLTAKLRLAWPQIKVALERGHSLKVIQPRPCYCSESRREGVRKWSRGGRRSRDTCPRQAERDERSKSALAGVRQRMEST